MIPNMALQWPKIADKIFFSQCACTRDLWHRKAQNDPNAKNDPKSRSGGNTTWTPEKCGAKSAKKTPQKTKKKNASCMLNLLGAPLRCSSSLGMFFSPRSLLLKRTQKNFQLRQVRFFILHKYWHFVTQNRKMTKRTTKFSVSGENQVQDEEFSKKKFPAKIQQKHWGKI